MKLSVVIPCCNEERTLPALLDRVFAVPLKGWDREVIVVDDGSTDSSPLIAQDYLHRHPQQMIWVARPKREGKGAAVHDGIQRAAGDVVLTQDADLEYDPFDYPALLAPFAEPAVQAVYGSRILGSSNRSYNRYYWGGRTVTWFANLLFGGGLTDEPTGYKAFRRDLIASLPLECKGFSFCPEVTAKLLRRGVRIHEAPIQYRPRSFQEGKKIRWMDGVRAIAALAYYRCF
jgi:glycosyltransferase involved in cell wall biosynthesis